jgi:hypothetical protein
MLVVALVEGVAVLLAPMVRFYRPERPTPNGRT